MVPLNMLRRAITCGAMLVLASLVTLIASAQKDEKKDNSKKVPIPTCDGVELQGTLWAGGKKDACVLLLHNFDKAKGGSSHQDGWDDLAENLQKEGYTVLSFDFRGFGESKTVSRSFWTKDHNKGVRGARTNPPKETIDYKDFVQPGYYLNLVNDIAAAKAYLDRQNDLKNLNSSNIIVIGAGEGATLGALWMAAEFKRARAPGGGFIGPAGLDDPEGRDIVCGVWLNISPTVAGNRVAVNNWTGQAGLKHKVPMLFMYGKDDKASEGIAIGHLQGIVKGFVVDQKPKDKAFEFTRNWGVKATSLTGSKLLSKSLDTNEIIRFYLNDNMEKRGAREARNRDMVKSAYYWTLGNRQTLPAKRSNEELPSSIIPLRELGLGVR